MTWSGGRLCRFAYSLTRLFPRTDTDHIATHVLDTCQVNVIDTDEKCPTYFEQSKLSEGFQAIVDGYLLIIYYS